MKSIDIKIEQARKRAEAEKKRPMTNPPKDGLTDILKTPRYDPAKPKVTTPPPEDNTDWGICCTAVGWFTTHKRSNP